MRPKGSIKTPGSGRQKGTPNKREAFEDVCLRLGLNVAEEMAKIASQPGHPEQGAMLRDMAKYIYPKLTSMVVTGDNLGVEINSEAIKELSQKLLSLTKIQNEK